MHSGIIFIGVLTLLCWVVQLLAVITVPITGEGTKYRLHLSHYNNISFGVFGVCDVISHTCSEPKIGYTSADDFTYWSESDASSVNTLSLIHLPSEAAHVISKLLVVHVIALVFTSLLGIQCCFVVVSDLMQNDKFRLKLLKAKTYLRQKLRRKAPEGLAPSENAVSVAPRPKRQVYLHLNVMLFIAIISFLLNLLAFLADILLFVPKLGVLGWIQVVPIVVMALIESLICFMKRSILSRRHLDNDVQNFTTDRRERKWSEEYSDDGFYIYSNGFRGADNEELHSTVSDTGDHYSHYQFSVEMESVTRSLADAAVGRQHTPA